MGNIKEIGRYIDENIESHINRLRKFVKQPSISVEGLGTKECAGLIRDRMIQLGLTNVDMFAADANPIVYGEYRTLNPDTTKTLLLYGAYDSNPVEVTNWTHPPFEGLIMERDAGTCMVARGVNNKMKVSGILNAIESLKQTLGDLPVNLLVVLDGEEEMFSPTLPQFVAKHERWLKQADALYMPFSSQNSQGIARVQLGYKGILYLELESSGKEWGKGPSEHEIHSMHRPVVDNPIWHLINALSTMTEEGGNRVTIEGFHEDIVQPSAEFLQVMDSLPTEFDVEAYKRGLKVGNLIDDANDPHEVLKLLFFTSQINIDGIWGGYTGPGAEAVIPPTARVKLEVRLIPNQQSRKVYSCIEKHLQEHGFSDIKIYKLAEVESCQTSINEEIAQSLIRAYQANGVKFQVWPSSIATIPIYLFNHPPLSLPFATGCVGFGGHSHGSDEFAVIKGKGKIAGLAEYEKCIASLIYEFGK